MKPLSTIQLESRTKLLKEWTQFKTKEHKETLKFINRLMSSQEKALKGLRAKSEELYLQAIEV